MTKTTVAVLPASWSKSVHALERLRAEEWSGVSFSSDPISGMRAYHSFSHVPIDVVKGPIECFVNLQRERNRPFRNDRKHTI